MFFRRFFLNKKTDHIDLFQPFEIINISYHHQKLEFYYLVKNITIHDYLHDHFDDKNYLNIKHVNQKCLNNNLYNNSIDPIEIIEPFVTLKSSHHYQKTTPLNIGEKNNNHIDLIDKFSPKTIKS